MKTLTCAKINLGLCVTARRTDGYHDLETVFYPIPLCDELEVVETRESDRLTLEGTPVAGEPADNLVMRTVRLLRDEGLRVPPVAIRLRKNIPTGAGLGGGSSDAAATMRLLNDMFALGLSPEAQEQRLARLGADCPFFVRHRPVFATGIGDQFTPIGLDLSGWWLLLVKPEDFVSTREAYAAIRPHRPAHDLRESIVRPVEDWPSRVQNDFEDSVFPAHPAIADIKARLYKAGARYAAMSGSGSSVFGLFRQQPSADVVASFAPHFTFCQTLGRG